MVHIPFPRIRGLLSLQRSTDTHPGGVVDAIPVTVIENIGKQCYSIHDVINLSRCSHQFRGPLIPLIYEQVELKTNRHCKLVLSYLSEHPEISQHVRFLTIRPNNVAWTIPGEEVNESVVASKVMCLAGDLEALESFVWDGIEMPDDALWLVMRTSCPRLRTIGSTIGSDPLNPISHMFDFSNLLSLSLTVSSRTLSWFSKSHPAHIEKLPRRFWQMIIERCPNLRSLTLGGPAPSPRRFDVRHVLSGRWYFLSSLVLGDVVLDVKTLHIGESIAQRDSVIRFLHAHPYIRVLGLQHLVHNSSFVPFVQVPTATLPMLDAFTGPIGYAHLLPCTWGSSDANGAAPRRLSFQNINPIHGIPFPSSPSTLSCYPSQQEFLDLRCLNLTNLHHSPKTFPPTLNVLRKLGSRLESVAIWVDLSFDRPSSAIEIHGRRAGIGRASHLEGGYSGLAFVRAVLDACPYLRHLDMKCFTRPSFSTQSFSDLLAHPYPHPSLRSFVLTKLHNDNDAKFSHTAASLVKDNPRLQHFVVKSAMDTWASAKGGRMKEINEVWVCRYSSLNKSRDDVGNVSVSQTLDGECGEKYEHVSAVRIVGREWTPKTFGNGTQVRCWALDVDVRGNLEPPEKSLAIHPHSLSSAFRSPSPSSPISLASPSSLFSYFSSSSHPTSSLPSSVSSCSTPSKPRQDMTRSNVEVSPAPPSSWGYISRINRVGGSLKRSVGGSLHRTASVPVSR